MSTETEAAMLTALPIEMIAVPTAAGYAIEFDLKEQPDIEEAFQAISDVHWRFLHYTTSALIGDDMECGDPAIYGKLTDLPPAAWLSVHEITVSAK